MHIQKRESLIEFLVLCIGVALLWYLGRFFHFDIPRIQKSLETFPRFFSVVLFILLYVKITFFIWFSKDLFRIAAALMFGAYVSTLCVWIAEIINGCIFFSLARRLGRDFVAGSLKVHHERLDNALSNTGFFWLFMLRATPLVPFRFFDIGCGLTALSFQRYLFVIVLGSLPRIFWLQYVLAGVGEAVLKDPRALVEYLSANPAAFIFTFIYLIVMCVVAWKIHAKGKT